MAQITSGTLIDALNARKELILIDQSDLINDCGARSRGLWFSSKTQIPGRVPTSVIHGPKLRSVVYDSRHGILLEPSKRARTVGMKYVDDSGGLLEEKVTPPKVRPMHASLSSKVIEDHGDNLTQDNHPSEHDLHHEKHPGASYIGIGGLCRKLPTSSDPSFVAVGLLKASITLCPASISTSRSPVW
ncbi:putative leucine-rich repeat receptor-like protein kinase-like [Dorcoceras hygrometricum]|uniref:Putative leucine-rich repeat receptor-like protein kinase-like n=1 Tax=Dorcoceras hygrometricum TaxID=472368 RepID=A0A2Z7C8P1_9LAMI|nr:putative leucine-rich repeat receptor-like protein kinase-like [Dorcoceras hygrometricum]